MVPRWHADRLPPHGRRRHWHLRYPSLGGPERKLRSTRMPWRGFSKISWSPDGKWIAFAEELPVQETVVGMYLLSTETLEARQIPISPKCESEGMPAFSHNGEYLAYWCFQSGSEAVLYFLRIPGGQPKMISSFRAFPNGLTWSADDKRLIYVLSYGSSDELDQTHRREWFDETACLRRKREDAHSFPQRRQTCL